MSILGYLTLAASKVDNWSEGAEKHPVKDKDIFNKSAKRIAEYFDNRTVTPEGTGKAIQRLNFYINRAGKNLDPKKKAKVKRAIDILQSKETKK